MAKERNSNIELLRIIAMAGVIFLHYFNAGMGGAIRFVSKGSSNELVLMVLESVFICAVDLFVMISGYFLSKNNSRFIGNALVLLLQTSIYRVGYYIAQVIIKHATIVPKTLFRLFLPANWFVVLYVTMYLVSPLLNRAFHASKKKTAVVLLSILFSVLPSAVDVLQHVMDVDLNSLSTLGMYGSERGYTITNFLLCYFIGAYLNEINLEKIKKRYLLIFLAVDIAVITAWSYWDATTAREYCNPCVVSAAAAILLLFSKMNLGQNRIINTISGAAFSVYLIHAWLFPLLQIERYVTGSLILMLLHIFVSIITILVICFIVDTGYKLVFGILNKKLKRAFELNL